MSTNGLQSVAIAGFAGTIEKNERFPECGFASEIVHNILNIYVTYFS
jgi:hypothetical protein